MANMISHLTTADEIHSEKLYRYTITRPANSNGYTYKNQIKWTADQVAALLDALPDGYTVELKAISIGVYSCTNLSARIYNTTGTSHSFSAFAEFINETTNQTYNNEILYWLRFRLNSSNADLNHYISSYMREDQTSFTVVNYDDNLAVQKNTAYTGNIYYRMYKLESTIPNI